jgi:hypothetical protein
MMEQYPPLEDEMPSLEAQTIEPHPPVEGGTPSLEPLRIAGNW